jgi:hypothetical protein
MRRFALTTLALSLLLGCESATRPEGAGDPTDATGGAGGSRPTGGAGAGATGGAGSGGTMETGRGGSAGGGPADAAGAGSGGGAGGASAGAGGATAGAGGATAGDAAATAPDAGAPGDVTGAGTGGGVIGFYEAEAVAPAGPNQLLPPAVVNGCPNMGPNCGAPDTIKPESMCCSQGKEVRQLLRGKGGLVFNKISAPADGMYDVTWWYHCGKNDNFGDGNCGGEPNHPAAGCRPHILTVNGARLPKVYEFHCFPGPWGEIHAVTTPLPLKAGDNSIRVVATAGRDAADLDAIALYPAGKGIPPVAFTH